jgi:hypothetical protein
MWLIKALSTDCGTDGADPWISSKGTTAKRNGIPILQATHYSLMVSTWLPRPRVAFRAYWHPGCYVRPSHFSLDNFGRLIRIRASDWKTKTARKMKEPISGRLGVTVLILHP